MNNDIIFLSNAEAKEQRETEAQATESHISKLDGAVKFGADTAGMVVGAASGYLAHKILTEAIPEQDTTFGKVARAVAIYGLTGGIAAISGMAVTNGATTAYASCKETVAAIKSVTDLMHQETEQDYVVHSVLDDMEGVV
jgi:hypothetical protein